MGLKEDLKAARKATAKLNAYSAGLPKGNIENKKYLELNAKANEAISKLPAHLRSRTAIELLG